MHRKHKRGPTHTNTGRIIYPRGTTPGIQPKHPPGEVWQSHAKWILQRKRFKAFIELSVFQAAASQGFDGLFSGPFLDFLRDSVAEEVDSVHVYMNTGLNSFMYVLF